MRYVIGSHRFIPHVISEIPHRCIIVCEANFNCSKDDSGSGVRFYIYSSEVTGVLSHKLNDFMYCCIEH
jgi:hypothetical protein